MKTASFLATTTAIVDLNELWDPQNSLLTGGGLMKVLALDLQCQILMALMVYSHLQLGSTVKQKQ